MKVIYDISVLGIGHVIPKARTGVFRVIENLAVHLAVNPDCNLMFCSNKDRQTAQYTAAYLKDMKGLSSVPFSKPPFFDRRLRIVNKRDELVGSLQNKNAVSSLKHLQIKLHLKSLGARERMFNMLDTGFIHPRDVREADIYHSPFYALPAAVSNGSYKSVFLTCYDVIPILFPQYFDASIIKLMDEILESITPETWVLCISASTRADLLNHLGSKVSPERVIVTELAASDTFYESKDKIKNQQVRRKHHIPDKPYILSLCTFEPRKNIEQVVKAFVRLIHQENIKDLHLVLVGNKGWLFDKIFEQIENSADVKSRIIITGFVADEDLAALYTDAMFFVYPSFYEGFGLPPLEAMKCGTPVITSNTSSLPEVVGDAGIMIPPTDLDALCHAMLSVYKSPVLRQQMADSSLERANRFSWERCANETVYAYKASLI